MWKYRVWLKGQKDVIEFRLADGDLFRQWEAWQMGDHSRKTGFATSDTHRAGFNFNEVVAMIAHEEGPAFGTGSFSDD